MGGSQSTNVTNVATNIGNTIQNSTTINEELINNIQNSVTFDKCDMKITIGNFTKPIITSGGFLIIKLNDIKSESVEIDRDVQFKKMIEFEKERQLTTFSTLYYKRIYNSAEINEK